MPLPPNSFFLKKSLLKIALLAITLYCCSEKCWKDELLLAGGPRIILLLQSASSLQTFCFGPWAISLLNEEILLCGFSSQTKYFSFNSISMLQAQCCVAKENWLLKAQMCERRLPLILLWAISPEKELFFSCAFSSLKVATWIANLELR